MIKELGVGVWGKHMVIDAFSCTKKLINDPAQVAAFAKELVKRIDMVAFGEPQVVYFGSGDKAGLTLVQLIETSNITAHFVPPYKCLFLDVFSCKNFDENVVRKTVKEFFHCKSMRTNILERNIDPILSLIPVEDLLPTI